MMRRARITIRVIDNLDNTSKSFSVEEGDKDELFGRILSMLATSQEKDAKLKSPKNKSGKVLTL